MKRWQFICFNFSAVSFFTFLVMAPIAYFFIFPAIIQTQLNNQNINQVTINRVAIGNFTDNKIGFLVRGHLPAVNPLPLKAATGDMTMYLHQRGNPDNCLFAIKVPGLQIQLNKPIQLDLDGSLSSDKCSTADTAALMAAFSAGNITRGFEFQIRVRVPIKLFGITIYPGLPLYKNLGAYEQSNVLVPSLTSILNLGPSYLKRTSDGDGMNAMLLSQFPNDVINIPLNDSNGNPLLPALHIETLDVGMDDLGIAVNTTIWLENPLKMDISDISDLSFGLRIEGYNTLNIAIAKLDLPFYNVTDGAFPLGLAIRIGFAGIAPTDMAAAIHAVVQKVIVDGDPDISTQVIGPVHINGVAFVNEITNPLAVDLPVGAILRAFHIDKLHDVLSLSGVLDLVGHANFGASVTSQQIVVPLAVSVGRPCQLPAAIVVPYNVSATVAYDGVSATRLSLWGVEFDTDNTTFTIKTTLALEPINTYAAADAIANAINPILGATPQNSHVDIVDLSFFENGDQPFTWSEELFNRTTLTIPIPAIINVDEIVSLLTHNYQSIPASIGALALAELEDQPGFNAIGHATVQLPDLLASVTSVNLNVGFIQMNATVEDVNAAGIVLPNGLIFNPGFPVDINASAILSRDPALPPKIQSLVSSFLSTQALPSYAGITGLIFGPSASQAFVTFSKIKVQLSTAKFQGWAARAYAGLSTTLLQPGMVKVQGVDLDVVTSRNLTVGLAATLKNPVNISVALGSTALDVTLDDGQLAHVVLPPLSIDLGTGQIAVKTSIGVATGANGMSAKIATLVNQVLNSSPTALVMAIKSLVLTPASGNPAGVIDQLNTVKIQLPTPLVNDIITRPIGNSPIDLSALYPTPDILKQLNIAPSAASLGTSPGAALNASASFGYINPLALSAHCGYFEAAVAIGGHDFVVSRVSGVNLVRGAGNMSLGVNLAFNQGDADLPATVNLFLQNFIAGSIAPYVEVKGIYFGSSADDRNDLFSAIDANLNNITKTIHTGEIVSDLLAASPIKFPAHVNDLVAQAQNALQGTITLNTLPQRALGVGANAKLTFGFPLTVELGYLSTHIGIQGNPLLAFSLPNGLTVDSSVVNLNTTIPFEDDDAADRAVGNLFANFFEGIALRTTIDARSVVIGASPYDTIRAFSQLNVSLPLDNLIALDGPTDVTSLLSTTKPVIGSVNAETRPGRNLGLSADISIVSPIQIQANIGYLASDIAINAQPLLRLSLPTGINVDATGGASHLAVNTALAFTDTDATQTVVAQVANNFFFRQHLGASIGIGGLTLGNSPFDTITALQYVDLPVNLERTLGILGIPLPFRLASALAGTNAKISSVTLHTVPDKSLFAAAAASFSVPFPISARIGYAAASAGLNGQPLANAIVPGIAITATGLTAATNASATLQFTDTDATQTQVATVVNNFLNANSIGGQASVANLFVGNSNSAADKLTILNKVNIVVDLDDVAHGLGFQVPFNIEDLASTIGTTHLGTIDVATIPNRAMSVAAGADFTLPLSFPVDIAIGYLYASSAVDGNPAVDLDASSGIAFNTLNGPRAAAGVKATLRFVDNEATRDSVADLVHQAFHATNGEIDGTVGANTIRIGYSAMDLITAFQKVDVTLQLANIVKQIGVEVPIQLSQLAENFNAKVAGASIATLPGRTLGVGAAAQFAMALPVSINFQTGYFHTGTTVGEQPLAYFDLGGLSITTDGQENHLN
ncbi:hypothetical protein BDK51DRAFT_34777, partial [Blyttiomyces helicus]